MKRGRTHLDAREKVGGVSFSIRNLTAFGYSRRVISPYTQMLKSLHGGVITVFAGSRNVMVPIGVRVPDPTWRCVFYLTSLKWVGYAYKIYDLIPQLLNAENFSSSTSFCLTLKYSQMPSICDKSKEYIFT